MRWLGLASLWLFASALTAQEKTPTPVTLKLHAAAAPTPALKYQLLPHVRELQPGNAAVFYHRAHSPDLRRNLDPLFAKMNQWLEAPTKDWQTSGARTLLNSAIYKELDRAARCENCDWQMTVRLREEGIALLVPDLQTFRQMADMLAVKARLDQFDGRTDDALHTLQTGLGMCRHVGDCPIVINALVGMAITQVMLGTVEDFVQRPGAPNLYWALRDLPEPFIDLRRPLQGDRLAVDAWWPEIRKALGEAKFQPLPPAVLRARLDKIFAYASYGEGRLVKATLVAVAHPQAVAYFRERGHTQEELDALPVTQVVLMYSLAQWDHWYDAVYRWHGVPYWQARAGIKKAAEQREQSLRSNREAMVFCQSLLPTYDRVFLDRARLHRRIAALQIVEAIRQHAAANNGNLPDTLDDIRDVPIPLDPVTGKSFEYTSDGASARLRGAAPAGEIESERNTLAYQISIVK